MGTLLTVLYILLGIGVFFNGLGSVGLLRFPEFFFLNEI